MFRWLCYLITCITLSACSPPEPEDDILMPIQTLIERGNVVEMRAAIESREITIEALTGAYLERIRDLDNKTNAIIALNPQALDDARALDASGASRDDLPPLFGIPVLIKDNIETRELPTTAGSLALKNNLTGRDAPIVAHLRSQGAVILGKTNLSEWANFRSSRSASGWSAVGGQTWNPHDLTRTPCGSSAGSAAAVSARFAPLAIGTETDGSIVCPAHINGVVGIKPTVGALSAALIVPISHSQDTAGPMALDVASAALLLDAMAGSDRFTAGLDGASLSGKRIGVVRSATGYHESVDEAFNDAIALMSGSGAIMVEDLTLKSTLKSFRSDTFNVLLYEFKHDLNAYLAGLPNDLNTLDLGKLIEFNAHNAAEEMSWFQQENFVAAEAKGSLEEEEYLTALANAQRETREDGIDRLLKEHQLDALIAPTGGPAWTIDQVNGDRWLGGFSTYPAVSGYPHVTVPMGMVHGLPVGLSITAGKDQDASIIALAHAFELARAVGSPMPDL